MTNEPHLPRRPLLFAFLTFVLAACASGPTPPGGSTPPPRQPDPNGTATLSIGGLALTPSLVQVGESVAVAFTVRNSGDDAAAANTFVYLNRDARSVTSAFPSLTHVAGTGGTEPVAASFRRMER